MNRRNNLLISGIFLLVVSAPLVLFLGGFRTSLSENRNPSPPPKLSVQDLLSGQFGEDGDNYLTDVLPGRDLAVRLDTDADLFFKDSPSPKVAVGNDGWLFLRESVDQECLDDTQLSALADELRRARSVVESSGRRLIVMIAPDKASIRADKLRFDTPCVRQNATNIESLAANGLAVTAWSELQSVNEPMMTFTPIDTHWTTHGAAVMGRKLINTLTPGSWNESYLERVADRPQSGDLARLIGKPEEQLLERYTSKGPGAAIRVATPVVDALGDEVPGLKVLHYASEGTPIPQKTLVLHNSFGWALIPTIAAYFDDVRFIRRPQPSTPYIRGFIEDAETIVILVVQRGAFPQLVGQGLAGEFAIALSDDLPSAPLRTSDDNITVVGPAGSSYLLIRTQDPTSRIDVVVDGATYQLTKELPAIAFVNRGAAFAVSTPDKVTLEGLLIP
jgi:acetyltransferase AlgX (SGNH hydrolase-like protein)